MSATTGVDLSTLPTWLLFVGGALAIVQLSFEIWALVDMLKRPADQLALGGRKWLWAIIILFVNWLGAILYFAVGRKPASAPEAAYAATTPDATAAAMDSLYGAREDGGRG